MNILHINTSNQHGGAETIAYTLFKSSKENSLLVHQNSGQEEGIIEFEKDKLDAFFNILTKLKWRFRPDFTFKKVFFLDDDFNHTFRKLKKLKIYKEADIVHLHNIHGGYFDLTALVEIAKEKKIVWTLHDMWCMTGGEAYTFENENYKIGIGKTPYLHVPPLNNPIIDRRQYYIELKKVIYSSISENLIFVPVSNWLNNCLKSSYIWSNNLKSIVIHNGIDNSTFLSYRNSSITVPKILIFNNNNIFKGENIFCDVLEKIVHPFELIVVGRAIEISNINLSKTTHIKPIKCRTELAKLYNNSTILLFPSKADNLPLVPMEAMACGVCVFASAVGGIPEIIEHSKTGLLFNTPIELINQLNYYLLHPEEINIISKNAAELIIEKFSQEKMVFEYQKLYLSL
jgi:glycosyltransferase involved in cell wall biosynthesis